MLAVIFFLNRDIIRLIKISIKELAFFTALAVTIFVIENIIPKPLPFMKLGLANAVILFIFIQYGIGVAAIVGYSKTFIGALLAGTILSPTILMSLGGTTLSLTMMFLAKKSKIPFSLIGISMIGAVSHNLAQIVIVRLVLIQDHGIFYLTPLLIILGIVTGTITGYIAWILKNKIFSRN